MTGFSSSPTPSTSIAHQIAGLEWSDTRRGPCRDDIPRQQRHHRRDEGHQFRHGEDEIGGRRVLPQRPVHPPADAQIRPIQPDGDARAHRREGVEPLGPRVVADGLLHGTRRDVVHARDAEDVLGGPFRRHPSRTAADDQGDFGFVIDPPDTRGQFNGIAGTDDRRRRLEKKQGLGRQRLALFGRVRLVVERHRDDLARHHRRQQTLPGETAGDHVAGLPIAKEIADQRAQRRRSPTHGRTRAGKIASAFSHSARGTAARSRMATAFRYRSATSALRRTSAFTAPSPRPGSTAPRCSAGSRCPRPRRRRRSAHWAAPSYRGTSSP